MSSSTTARDEVRPLAAHETHRPVSIVAVGDLMLGDTRPSVGFGFHSRHSREGLAAAAERLGPLLGGGDICFGNLEAVLSSQSVQPSPHRANQMRGLPSFADGLRRLGFDVLSVANNHADQHGGDAFAEMVSRLESVGIHCCGLPGAAPWSSRPVVVTVRGVRVGFLGYSLRPKQYGDMPETYVVGEQDRIVADVRRLSGEVDRVVVSLHWGQEFVSSPSESERAFGHALLSAGAALVLGHHPHVLRPVEQTEGGVIVYSLGNFMSDMIWCPELRRSMAVVCELANDGARVAELRPCQIGDDYLPGGVDPEPAFGESISYRPADAVPEGRYEELAEQGLQRQRRSLYAYAVRNLHRYDPTVLFPMVLETLRDRLGFLGRMWTSR